MTTHAHNTESNHDAIAARCRKCGNLTSRFGCSRGVCAGILPIEGGCAPLEWMSAVTEIHIRALLATGWDPSKRLSATALAEITENAYARVADDQAWLAAHPAEDPSRLAWSGRLRALVVAGITPIYATGADCGPNLTRRVRRLSRR